MEAASNRLQKEAKGYLDSLRGEYPDLKLVMLNGADESSHDCVTDAHCGDY